MPYCKSCGKEIPEGTVCDCIEADRKKENSKAKAKKRRKNKIYGFLTLLGILLVIILILIICISAGAYKRPVKKFARGINHHNTELLYEATLSDDNLNRKKIQIENTNITWKSYIKEFNRKLKTDVRNSGIKKVSFRITDKTKLKNEEFTSAKSRFSVTEDEEITKIYLVNAEVTIKKKKESSANNAVFYVAKIKDEGWKCFLVSGDTGVNISGYIGY